MEEEIKILNSKIEMLAEMIVALVLVQDIVAQARLRKAYPQLDKMMKKNNL